MHPFPNFDQDDRHPVLCVSWDDAKIFAEWLSSTTGRRYRLLTEAEWEYATRAGTTTRYSFGDDEGELSQYAWYQSNSRFRTNPVGEKKPNAFGLFDIHGNAWSWCEDNWHANYQGAPNDGSSWQGGDTSFRVLRGGAWFYPPEAVRSAVREKLPLQFRSYLVGFRVARTL